jgi:UPF0176 protein
VQRIAGFYRFTPLPADRLAELRQRLQARGEALGVRGTILLAGEGINGSLCGPADAVEGLLADLRQDPGLRSLQPTLGWSPRAAFQRFRVRLRPELVPIGRDGLDPVDGVGTYVEPARWNDLIRDPDSLVIDVRNSYETALGTFQGAVDPLTSCFRQFPAWVEGRLRDLVRQRRPRRLALFCTGGIRCEKATALLRREGFTGVHHLRGGILRYLEQVPQEESTWRGECFVFDQRVSVDHRLAPGSHRLCHGCRRPLSPADLLLPSYEEGVSCRHCRDHRSEADRERFRERQRQLARSRQDDGFRR